jgi:hypothetical protein
MASARINWHGQDLPVVREIVSIGGVETMVQIPGVDDPGARRIIAALTAIPKFERAGKLASVYLLEQLAQEYLSRGGTVESWRGYEITLGVQRSKTRQPESLFQPVLRWANGGKPDTTGLLAKLAAPLDEWLELGEERPSPITSTPGSSEFAQWLRENHGYTNVAGGRRQRRGESYSETEAEIAVPFDSSTASNFYKRLDADHDSPIARVRNHGRWDLRGSDWSTPQELYDELDAEFHFTIDVCASPSNAKCIKFFSEADDGLAQDWGENTCFMNSPHARALYDWMAKAYEAAQAGAIVVVSCRLQRILTGGIITQ